ncbi:MAG: hypothetical protein Q4B88_05140 [Moraxella sp.]|nr:hypothetical protein [Moraxella sp.]
MASENTEQMKRQMRITLVGVRPADQITLKGYLRVLLRLDVELEWVAATESVIDLFMINEEFRNAASVAKLLQTHQGVPVLYVNRVEVGDGGISGNLLTLPLKQINLLNDWLIRHVPVLSGLSRIATNVTALQTEAPAPVSPRPTATTTTTTHVAPQPIRSNINNEDLNALIYLIEQLQSRTNVTFELVEQDRVVAVIDAKTQQIWVKNNIQKLSSRLRLKAYQGAALNPAEAKDSVSWLWQLAWHNADAVMPLVDNITRHQVRYWVKPAMTEGRRELFQIMTAMEAAPISAVELAGRTGVTIAMAKRAIAALLFSGNLTTPSYSRLHAKAAESAATPAQPASISMPEPVAPTPVAPPPVPTPQQEEKMGFLARLRKKLGL